MSSYVTIGFSKPYVAKYSAAGTNVTYTGGMDLGRGVSLSLDIETADDNNFYADNVIAESESGVFTGGTANIVVDGLGSEAAEMILGLPEPESVTIGASKNVEMQGYGAAMDPPYVGFGAVRQTMRDGVIGYWPFILPKAKFSVPSDSMETREENINWQTQELEASIFRDDTAARNWKRVSKAPLDTEDDAYAVVKKILGGGVA